MATRQPLAIDAPEHFALIPRIGRYFDLIEVGGDLLHEPRDLLAAICRINGGNRAAIQRGRTE